MERSRESKRAASAPRRLRISCPKDRADAEARMDETPLIEKVKKGNLQAFPPAFPATATAWNKRKRNGFQEAHNLSEGGNSGKVFSELTPGEEYDDEALQGAVNSKQRAKKDELVMNICNIPRRARSSATRVPFAASRQPVTSQQRSPSPRILATKEEKLRQAGMKSRLLKDLGVMESAQISDQEVEVAEALFDLSRSLTSCIQSTSIACKDKYRRGLEEEEFNSSSSQIAEQKSKRQRFLHKQEGTSCMPSAERLNANRGCGISGLPLSVMEGIQVDKLECKLGNAGKLSCEQPDLMTRDNFKEPIHGYSQFHPADGKNTNNVEEKGHECKDSEGNQAHSPEQISNQALSVKSKQELWCSPPKVFSEEEIKDDYRKLSLSESSSSPSKNCNGEVMHANNESVNQGKVRGAPIKDESRSGTKDVQRWSRELSKATISPMKEEPNGLRLSDVKKEETVIPELCKGQEIFSAGGSLPSTVHPSSSMATSSMGWTGAIPQPGVNRKAGGPLWLTNNSHLGSTSYQVVQLSHAMSARYSSQRVRHCATHVYIAHFIQQQQQILSQPFWPPATNPYNLSSLPVSLQGKDHWSNKVPSLQAERGQTLAESIGSRLPNSRGYSNSAHVFSVGAGTKRGVGDTKSVMSPAQIKQHTMHLSGSGTVRMSLNGSPAQNASMFNKSLYSAHENLGQQASNMSHFPKGQQGHQASLHVSLSHSYSTQPQAQLHHQVRGEQLKQQRSHLTTSPQLYGAGSGAFLEGDWRGKQSILSSDPIHSQVSQAASPASSAISCQLSSQSSVSGGMPIIKSLSPSESKKVHSLGFSYEGNIVKACSTGFC